MKIIDDILLIYIWDSTEGQKSTVNDLLPAIRTGKYKEIIAVSIWEYEWGKWFSHIGVDRNEFEKALIDYDISLTIIYSSYGRCRNLTTPDPVHNTETIYFPLYWLYAAAKESKHLSSINLYSGLPKVVINKLATSLSNKPHPHRCTTMDYLKKHTFLDDMHFSWIETSEYYQFKYWEQKKSFLSDNYKDTLDSGKTPPAEVFKSAFEIIMESTPSGHFWTEKTFNAIQRERPFLIISKPGTNQLLEQYGFKSIIDELGLTEVENNHKDLDDHIMSEQYNIVEYIDNLIFSLNRNLTKYKSNPKELYDKLKPIAIHNRNRMKEIIEGKEISVLNRQ